MTTKDFYDFTGSDYNDVLGRLMNDAMIRKFVIKFKNDTSFSLLKEAVLSGDIEVAFNSAHTLKGVAANMGFKKLLLATTDLVEQLRPKNNPADKMLFNKVEEAYNIIIDHIDDLE